MATAGQVLSYLCNDVEWSLIGENYDDINWLGNKPSITKKQFTDGFNKYDAWKIEQDNAKAAAKEIAQAKLATLGLTVEDLTALGL